jgi:hypothetical protein
MPVYCEILKSRWTSVHLASRTTGTVKDRDPLWFIIMDDDRRHLLNNFKDNLAG